MLTISQVLTGSGYPVNFISVTKVCVCVCARVVCVCTSTLARAWCIAVSYSYNILGERLRMQCHCQQRYHIGPSFISQVLFSFILMSKPGPVPPYVFTAGPSARAKGDPTRQGPTTL